MGIFGQTPASRPNVVQFGLFDYGQEIQTEALPVIVVVSTRPDGRLTEARAPN
jgi:hypothetical protein